MSVSDAESSSATPKMARTTFGVVRTTPEVVRRTFWQLSRLRPSAAANQFRRAKSSTCRCRIVARHSNDLDAAVPLDGQTPVVILAENMDYQLVFLTRFRPPKK